MHTTIRTINTSFVLNINVNCYLIRQDDDFVLVDSGRASNHPVIEQALDAAGCNPGNLKLIALTHGAFDHCGNAAYLARQYDSKIARHLDESDHFQPDFPIAEGDNLAAYGFEARVLDLPGHSKGSVGFLTDEGDLFCGDLLANVGQSDLWSIMDDPVAAQARLSRARCGPLTIESDGNESNPGGNMMNRVEERGENETLAPLARVFEGLVVGLLLLLFGFFLLHQAINSGFFTVQFGRLEMICLYGPLLFGISAPAVRVWTGQRNPARPFDAATSLFLTVGSLWLVFVFPFDYAHLADVLPPALRFLLAWVTDNIAKAILILQVIIEPISAVLTILKYVSLHQQDSILHFERRTL